ncbi:MAG: DUF115 domain-containing protein, partial [Spirochaetes bacterium]|nr:DUF115 domain-containing protein [Spirochaetota bacterium]
EKKAFLFALPSSLPFLYSKKIFPDFVIAVDPGYGTFYHLLKYTKPIFLIAPLTICPTIFRLNNIMPIIFNYGTFLENILFENIDIVTSPAEGSVFINLLRILPQLGFDEAIIIGQDFGYKNHRSHVPEGIFEKEFLFWSNYFNPVENSIKKLEQAAERTSINVNGKEIITTFALKLYYQHFLDKKFSIRLILPESSYNPISDNIKKINYEYVLKNYPNKPGVRNIFPVQKFLQMQERKKKMLDFFNNFYINIKNNNNVTLEYKKIAEKIFIDLNNKKHIKKLSKIF